MALILCNFFSYKLGYPVDIQVILPSISPCDLGLEKDISHKILAKYPVVYLLHGHGNDYLSWSRFTSMQRYVEERRIATVTFSVGNKAYMNASYGENYYDFLETELPEFIKANFPISERLEDTYICGYSMGGYGALVHGLCHPKSYRAIGAFSSAIDIGSTQVSNSSKQKVPAHEFPEMIDLHKKLKEVVQSGENLPEIFMCVGKNDFLNTNVVKFDKELREQGLSPRFDHIVGYEHEWAFWDIELSKFLDWLPRTDPYSLMKNRKM
jgi:putative tributyrin esterase